MNKQDRMARKRGACGGVRYKEFRPETVSIDPERRIIEVKFASFGNMDSDRDILVRGCFAKSIKDRGPGSATNRKIGFLWQHDTKDPIGKPIEIEEREDGAYALIQLSDFEAVPNAKRAFSQLQDGTLNQFSFGFDYVWDKVEYDEQQEAFIVREVKLYEISVVTFGANERTEYIGEASDPDALKSALRSMAQKDRKQLNEIKQYVEELISEAEPVRPLTSGAGLLDKLANIN